MLEHLLADEAQFTHWDKATPEKILEAQENTSDWLTKLGAPDAQELITELQKADARKVFGEITTGADNPTVKGGLQKLTCPAAVKHLVAMLDAYDWEFIYQAQKIRGYAVAKILEDTQLPDPRHRLRALEMLGKITEIGLFTERIEVTKIDMTDEALEAKIKQKIDRFKNLIDVTDVIEHEPDTAIPASVVNQTHAPE